MWRLGMLGCCASLLVAGCSVPPVSVRRVDPRATYRELNADSLSSGTLSNSTRIVLRRHDLSRVFDQNPERAIATLHRNLAAGGGGPDEIFALAEMSFARADWIVHEIRLQTARQSTRGRRPAARVEAAGVEWEQHARMFFRAATVYAYAFLFPEEETQAIPLVDPRVRVAADLYNAALAEGLRKEDGDVDLSARTYRLPFGTIDVAFDRTDLDWGARTLVDFKPVAEYEVRGLANRYRRPGIGAPLAASAVPKGPETGGPSFFARRALIPATALLRIEQPRAQLRAAALHGVLDLYLAEETSVVTINGEQFPLEVEPSAALAATLEASRVWDGYIARFLGKALKIERPNQLAYLDRYRPGQIPVVFVHGTNSHPAVWANMVNDLESDPRIRHRYQFWFFTYDSGNPILYSSMLLRRALTQAVDTLDPDNRDRCLRSMTVVGHSQGGLLAKVTTIDSGTRFWDEFSSEPFENVRISARNRALVEESVFVEPLPFVRRVVFISTPHGGSYLAGYRLARRLAQRFIQFPADLVDMTADLVRIRDSLSSELSGARVQTSIDNMSPSHPFIRTLRSIPVAPGITAHSIISVKGDEPVGPDSSDGVVKFKSAQIDDVASEIVVRSGHSVLDNPHAVEDVRRILLEHADALPCAGGAPAQDQ
jgi:pimeloyl-ACP methyl ester carboxylesterase